MSSYRTIVADPPWDYGRDAGRWPMSPSGGDVVHKPIPYDAMALDAIASLPVAQLAQSDSCLWLWTTSRHLPEAFTVVEAWGFQYAQTLIWAKANPSPFGGTVCPNGGEFVLFAKRGRPKIGRLTGHSVLRFGGAPTHSAKPEGFLDLVESICPGPYLELFARRNRFGWDTWGNEAINHLEVGV